LLFIQIFNKFEEVDNYLVPLVIEVIYLDVKLLLILVEQNKLIEPDYQVINVNEIDDLLDQLDITSFDSFYNLDN